MQAAQKELYEVSSSIRSAVIVGAVHLRENSNKAMVLRFKREGQEHFTPAFRIKYMQTAGGMMYGIHDIIVNGLGSGIYEGDGEIGDLMTTVTMKIRQVIDRQENFADRFNRDDQRVVDLQVIMVDEELQPVGHTRHDEYVDLFPEAETITLELPADVKSGQASPLSSGKFLVPGSSI